MKKLLTTIIAFFTIFSIGNTYANNEGLLDKIMDFPFWVEEFRIRMDEPKYVYFYDQQSQNLYNSFIGVNNVLKDQLVKYYREWDIDYYRMNWIINDYNLYIYHSNKMFSYLSQKELRYEEQLDTIILKHYTLARNHYNTVKHLVETRKKKEVETDTYPYWWLSNNWGSYPYSYVETIPERWAWY